MSYEGRIRHIDSTIPLCPTCGGPTGEARLMQQREAELRRMDIALQAVDLVVERKGLDEAGALAYIRERQPDLAALAEKALKRRG